ncbi:hypothetical protein GCM10022226_18010 [Sphaerisporangium flaviroseum]|uniref:TNT domain-containing protein n=1 Tax=Sphaerisporangium flaviroseum TaxID=509199 RepID=A0ABP7HUX7_9ACTN
MRNFRRRASLAGAIGIVAASLTAVSAEAPAHAASRAGAPWATGVRATDPSVPATAAAGLASPAADDAEPACTAPYVNEDPRLGPKKLPKKRLLGHILRDYVPLGGIPPQKFLNRYWDWGAASYRYPHDFGFAHSGNYSNGRPLITPMTLRVGEKMDRFGGEGGAFLAPLGTPFSRRGIPPSSLVTLPIKPEYPCNYHAYEVSREFAVDSGPIASAFQQPGGGDQYHLVSRLIPEAPQLRPEVSVSWLVDNGYLQRLN